MGKIGFRVVYYILYSIAILPDFLFYRISDFAFMVMYHLLGYRKKVVLDNLRNAFPEREEKELEQISKEYFKYLCDLMLESLRMMGMSAEAFQQKVGLTDNGVFDDLATRKRSFIMVMGHLGNWEWASPAFSQRYTEHTLNVIYKPLSNPDFDKLIYDNRSKFNAVPIKMANTLRHLIKNKHQTSCTVFLADQMPSDDKSGMWINFLNQETLVFDGPEKISKMLDLAVVYICVTRPKRGEYLITPTLLYEEPKKTSFAEITLAFNRQLEKDIAKYPELWLWSHKRWKRKRPADIEIVHQPDPSR